MSTYILVTYLGPEVVLKTSGHVDQFNNLVVKDTESEKKTRHNSQCHNITQRDDPRTFQTSFPPDFPSIVPPTIPQRSKIPEVL